MLGHTEKIPATKMTDEQHRDDSGGPESPKITRVLLGIVQVVLVVVSTAVAGLTYYLLLGMGFSGTSFSSMSSTDKVLTLVWSASFIPVIFLFVRFIRTKFFLGAVSIVWAPLLLLFALIYCCATH